ncbi:MAG: DUF4255 domain-containing protein [Chitinophagaceae bacterium]
MIYDVLNFLKLRLESFLSEKRSSKEPLITLSNPWSNNDDNKNSSYLNSMSLINIEEEKTFISQGHKIVQGKNGKYYKKEPDLKVNLYVLISAYNKNYEDALKFISKVVGFYQQNNVFQKDRNNLQNDDFPVNVEKLIIELYTADFDQQSQIWGSLNTGYLPSVIYKVRMLIIDTDKADQEVSLIKEIKAGY